MIISGNNTGIINFLITVGFDIIPNKWREFHMNFSLGEEILTNSKSVFRRHSESENIFDGKEY